MDDGRWLLNGEEANAVTSACSWVALNPDACLDCELNPANKPAPGPRLRFLFHLLALQNAGAVFHYRDLRARDWGDLLTLKIEQQRFEAEQRRRQS